MKQKKFVVQGKWKGVSIKDLFATKKGAENRVKSYKKFGVKKVKLIKR